ncbi:hypothetical protein NONO_c64010 [Nocardia nova SH22a]|uniref:Low molecular weight antigen MTB12-like C-terminal domain-containing protein n=1 Tax=Nocardia nova SH22a TaxID=1415166 RepID=W5TVG0_9NOCA|nr:hypothetical protein [Nocardia nova]AHH21171.1 hypothetical protein NONO_c64010 [Nocardia nova SH22a]
MFNRRIAAKMLAACAVTALLAAGAACGSDDSDKTSASPSSSGPPTVTQAVTVNFEKFFDGATAADQKIALLENGPAFADAIKAQADSPMAKSASAKVTNVAMIDSDHADVTFDVLFNGKPALSGQQGSAVDVDNTWKVTASTFCALLTLEGAAPPVCAAAATNAPGATPAPAAPPTAAPAPTS